MKRVLFFIYIMFLINIKILAQFPTNIGIQGGFGNLGALGTIGQGGGVNTNFTAPENWIPDSVPLRIIQFIESDLNFYTSRIVDTTVKNFEIIPPFEKFNHAWLGNLAYAWYPTDFELRMKYKYDDFYFLNPFLDRIYLPNEFFFFRTNRPYTDLYYASSLRDIEQPVIKAIHTQNIDYYTNFGIVYQSYGAKEFVRQSNSSVNSVKFWFSKEKHFYRYQVNLFYSNVKLLDNGGIIDTNLFSQTFEQYYLTKAQTKITLFGINANPEIRLFQKKDSLKISIQNFLEATRHYHSYFDENPRNNPYIYSNIYTDSTYSNDSISYDRVINELRLKLLSHKIKMQLSVGYEGQDFYYFRGYIYKPKSLWFNNLYLKGGLEKLYLAKGLEFEIHSKYYVLGRKASYFRIHSALNYQNKKNIFSLVGEYNSQIPSYFITHYYGNTNRWLNTQFVNQKTLLIKTSLYSLDGKLALQANFWQIQDYINFNNSVPFQYGDTINVFEVKFFKSSQWKFFHLDSRINIQYTNKNYILNLPLFSTEQSFWLDFYVFKRAMRLNTGIDLYYTTEFNQYFYHPAIVAFYVNKNSFTGNMPIANIFINIHVKRMSLFFKFDFVNKSFMPIDYYATVTHYHYPSFFYRFGARWWFKN